MPDKMRIIEILPELDLGGVERHVIDLSNELAARGHKILVVSAGGQMQKQLSEKVEHRTLAVQKKNPLVGYYCARKIASWIKTEGWQIIHAHSRVPAWIAGWASHMAGVPYIVTAHVVFGNKSPWIYRPYRKAAKVICVSKAVQEGMKECFFENTQVIVNGLDEPKYKWSRPQEPPVKFLFVGRLSQVKGLQDALKAMPKDLDWTLDILGDGPMRKELEELTALLGLSAKVTFHGYSDQADKYMSCASCLLFPSYTEGMPLTLARAAQIGLPVIASNIPPVAEMAGTTKGLLEPGDIKAWHAAITDLIKNNDTYQLMPTDKIPTLQKMVDADEGIYQRLAGKKVGTR